MKLQSANLSALPPLHPGMYAPILHVVPLPVREPAPASRLEVPIDELNFCHLQGAAEIARIVHLRQQIQLPASALADPAFRTREKKETRRASSRHLSAAIHTSERFGSFR
jgi:hypothetical protein